jgi:hypothetical protein
LAVQRGGRFHRANPVGESIGSENLALEAEGEDLKTISSRQRRERTDEQKVKYFFRKFHEADEDIPRRVFYD